MSVEAVSNYGNLHNVKHKLTYPTAIYDHNSEEEGFHAESACTSI